MQTHYFTVSQITGYIKDLFDVDAQLQDVWLEGEVSNFTRSAAGHAYFTLKDERAQIRGVMWRSQVARLARLPRNGEAVMAHGYVSVYEAYGTYQLYADLIRPAGLGLLHLQFEALKARLEAEGLFAPERKRLLPPFPRRVGVVTSSTGAALRDILHVLGRRYPPVEVVLSPTMVQGDQAPAQIVAALQALDDYTDVDLTIVARGGGSLEELWAFNDERVARAIAASRAPVISGVGHETDFTIADFVADVRAPTPSVAAEIAVPDGRELRETVRLWQTQLEQLIRGQLGRQRQALAHQRQSLQRLSPQTRIVGHRQRIDDLTWAAVSNVRHRLALAREQLHRQAAELHALSPLATLERGYAIVRHGATGAVVRSVAQVSAGDEVEVRVADGTFGATVT